MKIIYFRNMCVKKLLQRYLRIQHIILPHCDLPAGVQVEEIKIPVPWGHVAGRWWGSRDKQPVIAIHGWQDNAGTWDNLIPLLTPTIAILCIDLPGQGLSSHYPPGMMYYKFWDGISLLRRIIKHFDWKNVSLLGHSLGGSVSFMYAAAFPDEVDRIVCIDIASPVIMGPRDFIKFTGPSIEQLLQYEKISPKSFVVDSYKDALDMVHDAYKGSVSRENCKVMMKRGATKTGKGYYFNRDLRCRASNLAMMSLTEALEYAGEIKCKVLNIRALSGHHLPSDKDVDHRYNVILDKLRETANLIYVEVEGTHHVHLNSPEKVAPLLEEFFEDLFY